MYDRREWHAVNQMYAAAGLPVVMPEDWGRIEAMAAHMDQVLADNQYVGELSGNPLAQAVASEMVCYALRPQDINEDWEPDPPHVDARWCPQDQSAAVRVLVVSRRTGEPVWVPLTRITDWEHVAQAYAPDQLCSAHNHPDCDYFTRSAVPAPDKPLRPYLIPRGENAVIIYVCPVCRKRMDNPSFVDEDYLQRGALPWYDNPVTAGSSGADDDVDLWDL